MTIQTLIKRIQKIMRQDDGVDGDAQRISQLVWMIFLKVYDAKEELWEFYEEDYESIIPEGLRWRNWAVDEKDGKALTGEELLSFVNNNLFPTLKQLQVDEMTDKRSAIVKNVFEDVNNYMKNGTLLRQVINILNDEVDFTEYKERHAFNDIYETILRDLQSAGSAGEFYTPRPVTEFIVDMLDPKLGERFADFACGTGGFLTSAIEHLEKEVKTPDDQELMRESIYGIEKKGLPYLLGMTNLILHDIDSPRIFHQNSLGQNVRDFKTEDKFDVIAMNPPYGAVEEDSIRFNFPKSMQTSETADLFMALIMYRMKTNGRAGVVLPEGFLVGEDNAKVAIKKKLLEEFSVHTIVKLPEGVFAPYTPISTNILFFDKTNKTENVWFYELELPEGYQRFSKTKPLIKKHFNQLNNWWDNRKENESAWMIPVEKIVSNNYNFNFKNPELSKRAQGNLSSLDMIDSAMKNQREILSLFEKLKRELEGDF